MGRKQPSGVVVRNQKNRLVARDGQGCFYCPPGQVHKNLTRDHVIPRSRGGFATVDNFVLACEPDNNGRGDEEFIVYASKRPGAIARLSQQTPMYVESARAAGIL